VGTKVCTKCGGEFPRTAEYFQVNRKCRDGLGSWCRSCHKRATQKSRDNDPNYLAKARARMQTVYAANPEAVKGRARQWREEHPDEVRQRDRRYRQENRPRARQQERDRRARERAAEGEHTTEEWTALCHAYDNRCLRCGDEGPLTVDHIVPLTRGGTHNLANLQPLCARCNVSKGNRHSTDYRPDRGQAARRIQEYFDQLLGRRA
jgi:5-methylcytosine-specific restriction endonuclease McrA